MTGKTSSLKLTLTFHGHVYNPSLHMTSWGVYLNMIQTFACKETEKIFNRNYSKKLPQDIQRVALTKLRMLSRSVDLNDLRIPPANRLEQLSGNRKGQHSIRINNQWRICFVWADNHAEQVEIVDYH